MAPTTNPTPAASLSIRNTLPLPRFNGINRDVMHRDKPRTIAETNFQGRSKTGGLLLSGFAGLTAIILPNLWCLRYA